jgi:para-aminobenzoate synthetase component 1
MKMPLFVERTNYLGEKRIPFFFLVDFEMEDPLIVIENQADCPEVFFNIRDRKNYTDFSFKEKRKVDIRINPIDFSRYENAFRLIRKEFVEGNSYLLNLTFQTPICLDTDLDEIFFRAEAPYKVWKKNDWVVFSPESFIQIQNNRINTTPMKGTIKASSPNALENLLRNEKELAEHCTIVDLMRNDLSTISKNVCVELFRYTEKIPTHQDGLWQTSSKITGELPHGWNNSIGSILEKLLPAGSISGAPKPKTLEIIQRVEKIKRGYYTGVAGYFDGFSLDSAVLIRFIENINGQYYYRSGGGITIYSEAEKEYQEMADKIYVPFS